MAARVRRIYLLDNAIHLRDSRRSGMKTPTPSASRLECQPPASDYVLRFDALSGAGRGLAFPCDAKGRVDLDALSEPARHNYFYARTLMGREFAFPVVREAAARERMATPPTHPAPAASTATAVTLSRRASSALSATLSFLHGVPLRAHGHAAR
jgi:hypothetical protein